tara:strand:+ start:5798 stop:6088 length:291 start_codon:yes stop_codon:yes gene_type:complete
MVGSVPLFFENFIDWLNHEDHFLGLHFYRYLYSRISDQIPFNSLRPCSSVVERILGKDEVGGSIPLEGSTGEVQQIVQNFKTNLQLPTKTNSNQNG